MGRRDWPHKAHLALCVQVLHLLLQLAFVQLRVSCGAAELRANRVENSKMSRTVKVHLVEDVFVMCDLGLLLCLCVRHLQPSIGVLLERSAPLIQ